MKGTCLPSVYTDASYKYVCRIPRLGVGIYFPKTGAKYAIGINPTNRYIIDSNIGEMIAIAIGIRLHPTSLPLVVFTDSLCSIENIYGLNTTPKYRNLAASIRLLMDSRQEQTWIRHVRGHSGVRGNVIADQLARRASRIKWMDKIPN